MLEFHVFSDCMGDSKVCFENRSDFLMTVFFWIMFDSMKEKIFSPVVCVQVEVALKQNIILKFQLMNFRLVCIKFCTSVMYRVLTFEKIYI